MNAQTFLDNFGFLANAPNGVLKLREMILSLAMQGKLVHQSSEDTRVSVLLTEIEVEKQRLVKKRLFRAPKHLPIKEEEILYSLPKEWKWVRFGEIARHNSGKTLDQKRNTGQPRDYITTSNLYWGSFELGELRQMLIREEELERCTARKGDLLICEGGEAGRAAVWPYDYEVSFQNHVHRCRFFYGIDPYYAYRFFEKLNATGEINQYRKGVGISNMSGKALASIVFPFPPIEEQKRIVAKVDELMALCDKLETQQQERQRLFPVLSHASHARFTESPSLDNLKAIFNDVETVSPEELRKTILSLAIRGKLVPQDQNDESADELLVKIKSLKSTSATSKKRKHLTSVAASIETKGSFEIPPSWLWVNFGEIMINRDGERVPVSKEEREGKEKIYDYYGASGVIDKIDNYLFDKPLLLIGEDGANLINRSTPIAFIARGKYWVNNHAHVLDGITEDFLRYIEIHINAINLESYVTGTAQPKMNQAKMNSIPIALPPLAEQARIVARVDQLMALADQLEQQQNRKNIIAGLFVQASVMSITGDEIKEPEKMKAPKTELITKLQVERKPRPSDKSPLANLIVQNQGEVTAKTLWQQSGMAIDAFYQQLKIEMANGWIAEPEKGFMKEVEAQ